VALLPVLLQGCFYDVDGGKYEPAEDTDTGDPDSGLGVSCQGDEDCASYVADTCLPNTMDVDAPGYCTISDCEPADCTGSYQCCDCSAVAMIGAVFCASESDASLVSAMDCTCE